MNSVGTQITSALKRLRRTQGWLAEVVGVSDNAVSKWIKTGKIARENIPKVSAALGVSADQLLSAGEPPPKPIVKQQPLQRLDEQEIELISLFRESSEVGRASIMAAAVLAPRADGYNPAGG